MKLIYLYIEDFPPFKKKEFNFDSEIRCAFSQDGSLRIDKGTDLPKDFFRITPRDNEYSRMTVSAVVGANASGKTSLARFFQSLHHDNRPPKCFLLFEAQMGDLWFWHNLKNGVRFAPSNQLCRGGHNGLPKDAREWVGHVQDCFTTVYYSPHYVPGAMTVGSRGQFNDLSTAGKMSRDIWEYEGREEYGKLSSSLQRDDAFQIVEARRLLTFMKDYKAAQDSGLAAGIDLPLAKGIAFRQNERARWEASTYFQEQGAATDTVRQAARGDTSSPTGWRNCRDILAGEYRSDFLLNLFVTFCGDYWRNTHMRSSISPEDDRFAQALFEICQTVRKNSLNGRMELARNQLLKDLERLGKQTVSIHSDAYPNERKPQYLFLLFRLLSELLARRTVGQGERIVLDFGKRGTENVLKLVELHARAKIFSDFLVFDIEPHLSAGQQAFLSLFARLHAYFKEYSELVGDNLISGGERPDSSAWKPPLRCGYLVFLDEVETSLHPEWQRLLVWHLLWFVENFWAREKMHLVFLSHSPNLLSDIPRGNVCFLGGDERQEEDLPNTFGANIFDLYKSCFFLDDGPVGAFAKDKIRDALTEVASLVSTAQKKCGKDEPPKKLSEKSKRILGLVGDELLRRYLDVLKEVGLA